MKLIIGFKTVTGWVALLIVTVYSASSYAETDLEREILSAPPPHTVVPQGRSEVTVHFASLRGYLVGNPNNAIRPQALRDQAGQCVAEKQSNGYPVKLPTEWLDHLNGMREDHYERPYVHHVLSGLGVRGCQSHRLQPACEYRQARIGGTAIVGGALPD